jgi:TM2 domain-containing membrane protein YozV
MSQHDICKVIAALTEQKNQGRISESEFLSEVSKAIEKHNLRNSQKNGFDFGNEAITENDQGDWDCAIREELAPDNKEAYVHGRLNDFFGLRAKPTRAGFADSRDCNIVIKGNLPWECESIQVGYTEMPAAKYEKAFEKKQQKNDHLRDMLARKTMNSLRNSHTKRNPLLSSLLSLLAPGLGHLYIGRYVTGAVLLGIFAAIFVFYYSSSGFNMNLHIGFCILASVFAGFQTSEINSTINRRQFRLARVQNSI